MTIAALLSHFGINASRYATRDGEIVFGPLSRVDPDTFTHPIHGPVTPVANHTFHDGNEAADPADVSSIWWNNSAALHRHIEAMTRAFPNFTYVAPESAAVDPSWHGSINTGRGRYPLAMFLRRDQSLPRAAVLNRKLSAPAGRWWDRSPHLYTNGNLCIADRGDWDPSKHTVATATAWAAHWLAAYTEWRMSRRWPVDGVRVVST